MLEVLFMIKNGTTSQLTSCWSTIMHSTSSYDAQSKRYAIFKMPTQCRVCEKQRKRGTKFWQVLDVVCVDDNGDPHVNNGSTKKFGDIFPASGGIVPGRNSCRVVSLGHWASSVLLLQIGTASGGLISSCAFVRSPWCHCLPLWTCWTNERNLERTVPGEADSRDPPGLW